MIGNEKLTRVEIIAKYKDDTVKMLRYLPWMEEYDHQSELSSIYSEQGLEEHSMPVPLLDNTLLNFVKIANKTKFMNKNYVYTYSKFRIKTPQQEREMIEKCGLRDINILGDILSNYVLKGMVKASVWVDGMKEGIFPAVLRRLRELLEIR